MPVETEWVFGQNGTFPLVIPLMPAPYNAFQKQWKERVASSEAHLLYSFGKTTDNSETSDAGLIEHGLECTDHIFGPLLFPFTEMY